MIVQIHAVAIELGEFKCGELAPRIKALSLKKEELLQAKADADENLRYKNVDMADPQVVQDYADDLGSLLAKSSMTEQRSFRKSFVERIEVDESKAKVYYTIPMPPYSVFEETVGVLPFRTPWLKERGIKGIRLIRGLEKSGGI